MNTFEAQDAGAGTVIQSRSSIVPMMELYGAEPAAGSSAVAFDEAASPFAESMAALSEYELEAQVFNDLLGELEDEEFDGALEALVEEGAARHMAAQVAWQPSPEAAVMAETDLEQWMESLIAATDATIAELGTQYEGQSLESFADEFEFENSSGPDPLNAQELFLGALRKKFRKVASAIKKGVKKGINFVKNLNPLKRILDALRRAARPLLKRLLNRILGKLPRSVQPIARKLASRLGVPVGTGAEALEELSESETFDLEVVEHLLASPLDGEEEGSFAMEASAPYATAGAVVDDLDRARARLTDQFLELPEGTNPVEEMEQFIPVVMAALPLIRGGIRIIGRKRVVNAIAKVIAPLASKLVGRDAGRTVSRHLVDHGLRFLSLEAESGGDIDRIGAEALVATAEDAIRQIAMLEDETVDDPALLAAEVQEAFAAAARRHLPPEVLRTDLNDAGPHEAGVWMLMPRAGNVRRFKRLSRVVPVRIDRSLARSVLLSGGETLEGRLADAGVETWPVAAELEVYELLPGASVGHIIGAEVGDGVDASADEFDELTDEVATALTGDAELAGKSRSVRGQRRGRRVFRLKVKGRPVRRRSRFSVRYTVAGSRPMIALQLRLSEREAHRMSTLLERRQTVQVLVGLRRLTDTALEQALAVRLTHMLTRRRVTVTSKQSLIIADAVTDSLVKAVSKQLGVIAPQLAAAAKDPKPGVTFTVTCTFANQERLLQGQVESAQVTVRPGGHRGP